MTLGQRVHVVGCSGSGKTTFARWLAATGGHTHVELDALYHQAGWAPRERDAFRADVAERLEAPRWVVDGNYGSHVRDLVWEHADTVVWLDLPRREVLPSVFTRTVRRGLLREELWNGNRERALQVLDPRPDHNIVMWAVTRFAGYRRAYLDAMIDPANARLRFVRLRSRAEVRALTG